MRRSAPDHFVIHDPEAVAEVVGRCIKVLGQGRQDVAATKAKLPASTLSKLRHGRLQAISPETAKLVERAAQKAGGDDLADAFVQAVLSAEGSRLYRDGYLSWCAERGERFARSAKTLWLRDAAGLPLNATGSPLRAWEIGGLVTKLETAFPELWRRFTDKMSRKGVETGRQRLALVRVVEPLAEHAASGFVEMSWDEMHAAGTLRDFVDHGLKRERLLLCRERATKRAREVATVPRPPAPGGPIGVRATAAGRRNATRRKRAR